MMGPEQVLSDFIDAWNAGRRPRVREYLERVPAGADRDALAQEITTWLEVAPTPPYSDEARAAIRREPAVQQVFATVGEDESAWPVMLPRLRERAGLTLHDLASRLTDRLGLGGGERSARAAEYLEQMERGELRSDRVSRRLLDALGGLLGVDGRSLGDLDGSAGGMRPAAAGGMLFRTEEPTMGREASHDIDVLSRAAMADAPPPMDELDELFCGGPDA